MPPTTLFKPVNLGSIALRNRIVMSALTRDRSIPTSVPNEVNKEYYTQRAEGGAGLIVTEGTLVSQQGTEWQHAPGIWSDEHVKGWKEITESVHSVGGKIVLQLWHVGRVAHPEAPEQKQAGIPVYAPSAISARGGKFRFIEGKPGYVKPTAVQDPTTLIALFKNGAIKAKEAGFDGVELHSANGYLVHQFLDNTSNKRTDEWGGSVENRCRFGLETINAILDVWGADRVGIKLSPCGGYNDVGMTLPDTIATYSHFVSELDKLGLAYINFVRYLPAFDVEFDGKKRATQHDVIKTYHPLVKNTKFVINGGILPDEGEKLIEAGDADVIAIGALFISNPDLAKRAQEGKDLNTNLDFKTFYGREGGLDEQRHGYTDYPTAT